MPRHHTPSGPGTLGPEPPLSLTPGSHGPLAFGGFSSSQPLFRIEASEHLSSHMEPTFITRITTSEKHELVNVIMYVKHLINPVAWNDS